MWCNGRTTCSSSKVRQSFNVHKFMEEHKPPQHEPPMGRWPERRERRNECAENGNNEIALWSIFSNELFFLFGFSLTTIFAEIIRHYILLLLLFPYKKFLPIFCASFFVLHTKLPLTRFPKTFRSRYILSGQWVKRIITIKIALWNKAIATTTMTKRNEIRQGIVRNRVSFEIIY